MRTDVIQIYSDLRGREEAMATAEKFCGYNGFTGRNAMHIRLLTEELVSMVNGIMDEFIGDLWFESEKTPEGMLCRICVEGQKSADPFQEEHFLSVASSGKNENAKGILGKIRELFRVSSQYSGEGVYMSEYTAVNSWYNMGTHRAGPADNLMSEQYWSLMEYRNNLNEARKDSSEWDELEKSIIANIADEVKVWLKSSSTLVTVEKLVKN